MNQCVISILKGAIAKTGDEAVQHYFCDVATFPQPPWCLCGFEKHQFCHA